MTIKQTYEFLSQLRRLEPRIKHAIQKCENIEQSLRASGIRYDLDKIQTTPSDHLADTMAIWADLTKEIEVMQAEKERILVDMITNIRKLEDDCEQTVLMEYYIGSRNVEEIAERMPCSVRSVYYWKRRGVSHLSNILK